MPANPDSPRREIFLQAAEIDDPRARAAYLDTACGDGGELRRRLEALLAAEAEAGPPPEVASPARIHPLELKATDTFRMHRRVELRFKQRVDKHRGFRKIRDHQVDCCVTSVGLMRLSKRQFLKLSLGGTAAVFLAPALPAGLLCAKPVPLPLGYLEGSTHRLWMRLSYNRRAESRQVRRLLGAALRNIGVARGRGRGYQSAPPFDQAIQEVFRRWMTTSQKPASVFGLVQAVYDELVLKGQQNEAGEPLFLTLFYLLRGRDGTAEGAAAHQSYIEYREALLAYKAAYRTMPADVDGARERKQLALSNWREHLRALADIYLVGQRRLSGDFLITADMLEGFGLSVTPLRILAPRLQVQRSANHLVVSWPGEAKLQHAPAVAGPWSDIDLPSPAELDTSEGAGFFRTVAAPDDD